MARRVLERESELAAITRAAQVARAGHGSLVLVSGEAGIGKSTLVESMRSRLPGDIRVLIGRCDDLSTPRVLGPIAELAAGFGPRLAALATEGTDRPRLLDALHTELRARGARTVLVVEDVHWADDVTLDVLGYLLPRLAATPTLLVLTFRDVGLPRRHRLRLLLGLAAGLDACTRLPLQPLSAAAVRDLCAGSGLDHTDVVAVTGGNPFFVHSVLEHDGPGELPPTVLDAVRARVARLDDDVVTVLEQLSVVPGTVQRMLFRTLFHEAGHALVTAEQHGLLLVTPDTVTFRHELTRRAVLEALPRARRAELHQRALAALENLGSDDLALLVNHASGAGDAVAVARHGPAAARQAAQRGAHREAAAHYQRVLAHRDRFGAAEVAALLDESALESYLVGDNERRAVADQHDAVGVRRSLGEPVALARSLRWLSRMSSWAGDSDVARAAASECLSLAERSGDPTLLALATSNDVQVAMTWGGASATVEAAGRAVDLARTAGGADVISHALNNLGCLTWSRDKAKARVLLDEAALVAEAAGEVEHACRALCNLLFWCLDDHDLLGARAALGRGLGMAEGSEHVAFAMWFSIGEGFIELAAGHWEGAARQASRALDAVDPIRCHALVLLSIVDVRTGRQGDHVAPAWALARKLDWPPLAASAALVVAEEAWLRSDPATVREVARTAYDRAVTDDNRVAQPIAAFWLSTAGVQVDPGSSDDPFALLARGGWQAAADRFGAAGYPYERGLALLHSSRPSVIAAALADLESLGAWPAAALARRRLRGLGVADVPRGARPTTRANVAGLTDRQLDVLTFVAEGSTNPEIAERLVLSVRTVDNHVAAAMAKLGAATRQEAVEVARARGWHSGVVRRT